jgi:hypothetical protein
MSRAKELIRVQRETLNRSSELLRQSMRQCTAWQLLFVEAEAKAKAAAEATAQKELQIAYWQKKLDEVVAQRDEYQRQWRHAAEGHLREFSDPKEVLKAAAKRAKRQ